ATSPTPRAGERQPGRNSSKPRRRPGGSGSTSRRNMPPRAMSRTKPEWMPRRPAHDSRTTASNESRGAEREGSGPTPLPPSLDTSPSFSPNSSNRAASLLLSSSGRELLPIGVGRVGGDGEAAVGAREHRVRDARHAPAAELLERLLQRLG